MLPLTLWNHRKCFLFLNSCEIESKANYFLINCFNFKGIEMWGDDDDVTKQTETEGKFTS